MWGDDIILQNTLIGCKAGQLGVEVMNKCGVFPSLENVSTMNNFI